MTTVLFRSFRPYRREWLRPDLVAGLTVWAVLVPEALAYATIAGVPPIVGLYAAPGALVLYAVFGSSRQLVTGPMAATAALSAAAVADVASGSDDVVGLTVALALVCSVVALLAGLLRLGFVANFISEPVLKGFIVGLSLTIIIGQVPKILGVEKEEGNAFVQVWHVLTELGNAQWRPLVLGAGCLAIALALRRWLPMVPGSLVAVAVGTMAVKAFGLDAEGVAVVGDIDSGLPPFGLPDGVPFDDYVALAGAAVGVTVVGFAEGLGAAKTYAARRHEEIDPDSELLGLGAANLASGLSGGMVVNGSLSKTAVNGSAGARSQLSGLTVAALTVVTLLFLTDLFADLPDATLAAVVIAAIIELVDVRSIVALYRVHTRRLGAIYGRAARADFVAATAALLGVLVFDTLPGLFIGIAMSLLLLLYRSSRPHVAELGAAPGSDGSYHDLDRHPDHTATAGVVVLRPEAGLFFANAGAIRSSVLEAVAGRPDARGVVLDAQTVPFVDVTALKMLQELRDQLADLGVTLVVARDVGQVHDLLDAGPPSPGPSGPGSIPVHATVRDAVAALTDRER